MLQQFSGKVLTTFSVDIKIQTSYYSRHALEGRMPRPAASRLSTEKPAGGISA